MQSPAPFEQPWAPHAAQKTNGTAIFALVASILGYFCFAGVGGALGIVLGLIARSEIKRSEGREGGRGIANTAVGLGIANLTLSIVGLGVLIAMAVTDAHPSSKSSPVGVTPPGFLAPPAAVPPPPAKTAPHKHEAKSSRALGTEVTSIGAIAVADISGDFEGEIETQRHAADAAGETLVLWVVVRDCKPCDGVAASLTSPLLQKALGKTRLVRVDRDDYQIELERLGIPTKKIPGFALLDGRSHVRDFIHGGEWGADTAVNIAPVLGKFVHGGYRQRHDQWQGGAREDETPI